MIWPMLHSLLVLKTWQVFLGPYGRGHCAADKVMSVLTAGKSDGQSRARPNKTDDIPPVRNGLSSTFCSGSPSLSCFTSLRALTAKIEGDAQAVAVFMR